MHCMKYMRRTRCFRRRAHLNRLLKGAPQEQPSFKEADGLGFRELFLADDQRVEQLARVLLNQIVLKNIKPPDGVAIARLD